MRSRMMTVATLATLVLCWKAEGALGATADPNANPYLEPATVAAAATLAGPVAAIDLTTREGVEAFGARWRYSDVTIAEAPFHAVGPDHKPSGPPNTTYDFSPHAGGRDFDDSAWPVIDATSLSDRRGNGKLSFNWYRIGLTVPARWNGVDLVGTTATFEITVDDYAEIWVDGVLPRTLGAANPPLVQGWNTPNRVVIAREVTPGTRIQLAVFGINGPISEPPSNYIWVRSARVVFSRGDVTAMSRMLPEGVNAAMPAAAATMSTATKAAGAMVAAMPMAATAAGTLPGERVLSATTAGAGRVLRLDRALDGIVPASVRIEKLADGFQFGEGPIWSRDGHLLFSDPNANVIYRYDPASGVSVFRRNSGIPAGDLSAYHQPGSNGLTFDRMGRLTLCQHGNRRVARLESDATEAVLADRYEGHRLNSPNDLVYRSDGALYFTDPPFGLPKVFDDPAKELPYSGVYCWRNGALKLLIQDLEGPNGIAFSPDERTLYVSNWDEHRKVVMGYDVMPDGGVRGARVFADLTPAAGPEALDGLKVDQRGNVYVSGPGGVWIFSAAGRHLGTIQCAELPANFAWGDADGRSLYMTARTGLYRIRLNVAGSPAESMMSSR